VSDTIKALRDLMADIDRTSGQIYNVGAPNQISVIGLAERIKLMTGSSSDTVHVPFAEVYGSGIDDMLHRVPCIDKIRDAIGWHPMHTLEEILHDVIEHATAPAEVGVPAGIAA
jgi:UDP-glucose 4-epimerase